MLCTPLSPAHSQTDARLLTCLVAATVGKPGTNQVGLGRCQDPSNQDLAKAHLVSARYGVTKAASQGGEGSNVRVRVRARKSTGVRSARQTNTKSQNGLGRVSDPGWRQPPGLWFAWGCKGHSGKHLPGRVAGPQASCDTLRTGVSPYRDFKFTGAPVFPQGRVGETEIVP